MGIPSSYKCVLRMPVKIYVTSWISKAAFLKIQTIVFCINLKIAVDFALHLGIPIKYIPAYLLKYNYSNE